MGGVGGSFGGRISGDFGEILSGGLGGFWGGFGGILLTIDHLSMTGQLCTVLFVLALRGPLWLPALLYGLWLLADRDTPRRGGRPCAWVRAWPVWNHFRDYFPISLIRTVPLDPGRNYVFGFHPHGVLASGAFGNFCTEATGFGRLFPGLRPRLLTLPCWFRLPLFRDYAMAGGLCPVSRRCLDAVLARRSQALLIVVGGAAEALEGTPGRHRVTLRQRRGFVRLALRHGAPLVPVYVFGEQDAFRAPALAEGSLLRRLQRGLKRILGFAPCIFWGRGGLPFLPFRVPLTVVVGTPLEVPRVPRPSPELVAHYHELYVQRLQELFERHKVACGVPPETPLIIA
uniref:Acyltransferase n=1 Tax=Geospiza parvula TaxID=87175 RepID=A0A8C3MJU2_GEOPR